MIIVYCVCDRFGRDHAFTAPLKVTVDKFSQPTAFAHQYDNCHISYPILFLVFVLFCIIFDLLGPL